MEVFKYHCKNGRDILIHIDEDMPAARVVTLDGKEIGRLEFREIDDEVSRPVLKLTWAYLDLLDRSYRFQGIGRECLRLVKDIFGLTIIAENHGGLRQGDGGHLTGDAVTFVTRMRREGLIAPYHGDDD